ncbi:alpha/beta fold hydrolase [Lysobacter solisilvae (ex Woo and Kim 2020)]|uniref:Alpha/beta fold hydrolase n=1 Tax=Agrilutibacter terrestris TaxID=2865112 RepID=A0A7H0G106_9GAMM|nr:alpha/beta fold hydrolase [Lysobacter terrestris]QNP41972.1 alpha/beta fold hydrolase [Lysobacter terrestris]
MSRKLRIALAAAVALGLIGYRQWQAQDDSQAATPRTAQPGDASKRGDSKASAATPVRTFGRIDFKPCVLTGEQGLPPVEAQCATFPVPEDRAHPQARTIALNIAWLPADAKGGGAPDPVFFLAGGPGQAATAYAAQIDQALNEVRKQRDIVLVDQRGTGKSNPLDCRDAKGDALKFDETAELDEAVLSAYVGQCLQSLQGRADPRFYTTGDAIADLDAVRAALGAEKVNVMGGSYGTRVAQQYAMHYPTHTRSVVLDGVAPNRVVVGGEFAQQLQQALHRQDALCAKLPACKARYAGTGDLVARLGALKAKLAAAPVRVSYRDPDTNEPRQDTLTADTLMGLTHGVSYVPQLSSLLPLIVSEAEQGRYEPLMSIARFWSNQVGDMLNRGMQWSVVCAEDAPRYQPDPRDADTVLGPDMARMFFFACKQWPRGRMAADFTTPFTTELPVLITSGELDPVTPPSYGEEVVKHLGNGRHLVLRGQGHGAMSLGCMPKLLGRFFETADAKALDAKCLDSLNYVPPFTSFNGWEP